MVTSPELDRPYFSKYGGFINMDESGWITLDMPDLELEVMIMVIFFSLTGSDNSYSNNFLRSLYLDVIVTK